MATTINKVEVFNPISMFNTVGQELESVVDIHNKDKKWLLNNLGWSDFASVKKIHKKDLRLIIKYLEVDSSVESFFVNFQNNYKEREKDALISYKTSKGHFNKFKQIIPLLKDDFKDGIDLLEDITNFFGVETEEEVIRESENCAALFRKQNKVPVDAINLKAWLRRGELDFKKMTLPEYDEKMLMQWIEGRDWMSHIENVDYFMTLPKILGEFGVALVFVPYLKNTVYGAIKWIDGKPLVQLSDRNQDLASCWFTLFHEFGHTQLHKNDTIFEGEINEAKTTKKESEANKFANVFLFNGDDLRKTVFNIKRSGSQTDAGELSKQFDVHPLFAAYWLRKAQYQPARQRHIPIRFSYESINTTYQLIQ